MFLANECVFFPVLLLPATAFSPIAPLHRGCYSSAAEREGYFHLRLEKTGSTVEALKNKVEEEMLLERQEKFDPFQVSEESENAGVAMVRGRDTQFVIGNSREQSNELNIWAARGILLIVAAIWGTNFASVKYLTSLCFHPPCNHPPSEPAFARFGVAALVSLPLLFGQRKDVILAGLECGFWISLGYMAQAVALTTISAGTCAFICSLTVVFVPVVSFFVYGKPIKPMNILAGLVALFGVGVLEGMLDIPSLLGVSPAMAETGSVIDSSSLETSMSGSLGTIAQSLGVSKGDIIALGQPIGFGYSFTRIEYYQEKFKDVPNRVLTIAAAQCIAVGLLSLMWVLYDYSWTFPNFSYMIEPHRLATIAWTGIVTTVFAIFLQGIALQKLSATDAAITFSSEPVWASFFGYLLLKEQLGLNAYAGGTVIMLACLLGAKSDLNPVSTDDD